MKRLFLALPLSEAAAAQLWENWEGLRFSSRRVKWIPQEYFHITMIFAGDTNEELIPDLVEVMEDTGSRYPSMEIETGGPGRFPPSGRPRVLFESVDQGGQGVIRLQKHLVRHLSPLISVERRKFIPHITTARIRQHDTFRDDVLTGLPVTPVRDTLNSLVLFESILSPEGARYYEVHTTELTG